MNSDELQQVIVKALQSQGFVLEGGLMRAPESRSKDDLRKLHATAVAHKRLQAKKSLIRFEPQLLRRFANGSEVDPYGISPYLVEVQSESSDELLFRYATLHWSIPVSNGYGRRLRFLVLDSQNNKLVGIIGLADPVYSLKDRDSWIGWPSEIKRNRLRHVMDAFVLGAVPPYSQLLCGKLVAMLVGCSEVRQAFQRKYGDSVSRIAKTPTDGQLALVTTLSALGRSSIYNRLTYQGRRLFEPIGFSGGSGEFQFTNGVYKAMFDFATENCRWTAKNPAWGTGSRNRREVVRKCLQRLGLKEALLYHGVRRQIFGIPLASNARPFLRGQDTRLQAFSDSASQMWDFFRERWLVKRIEQRQQYVHFTPSSMALWTGSELGGEPNARKLS